MPAADMKKVLIVDDEPDLVEVLRIRLSAQPGCVVRTASDGKTGFDLARKWRPDVVVLDVAMPRVDGWQMLERLKEEPAAAKIPVIVLTAWISPETEARAKELKAARLMVKPFEEEELLEAVRRLGGLARQAGDPNSPIERRHGEAPPRQREAA